MRPKKFLLILLFACAFLYLLCRPQAASASVCSGLLLWYHSVVPTLLPFMLLTGFLLRLRLLEPLLPFLQRCLAPIFGCSGYGAFAILCGFTAGFPMGSKLTRTLLDQKKISHEEACHLIGFVNNPSPAFLLSYVAADQWQHPELGILLIGNVFGSALLYGILSSFRFRSVRTDTPSRSDPVRAATIHESPQDCFALIDSCIEDAVSATIRIGVYLIVFSILVDAAASVPLASTPVGLVLFAALELTNGIHLIAHSALSFPVQLVLIPALAAFGGCSVIAQSVGIASMDHDMLRSYLKSRPGVVMISCLLSFLILLTGNYK